MQRHGRFLQDARLNSLRQRERKALDQEYHLHRDALLRRARRLGLGGSDAEDVVQSVWATFLRVVPRFEGRSQVRTFLLGILRREARRARQRTHRTTLLAFDELEHRLEPHGSENAPVELADALAGCVGELATKERRAVELKLLEARDTEEVRRALGVTANYLGVLLHRARAHLRDCLAAHLA